MGAYFKPKLGSSPVLLSGLWFAMAAMYKQLPSGVVI
jgi:hypothetical protein